MAFMLSPGVQVTETDLTNVVPAVATSIGGFVGVFQWGPVLDIESIDYQGSLTKKFGKPNNDTATSFFSAANFLDYTNQLKVVRVVGANAKNATTGGTGFLIKNKSDYEYNYDDGLANVGMFAAKYPGEMGNSIQIVMADKATYSTWEYRANFTNAPNVGESENDELHILILDKNGKFTGVPGSILEKYQFLSKAHDSKGTDGQTNYYKTVINRSSEYVYWMDHPTTEVVGRAITFDETADTVVLANHGKKNGDAVKFDTVTTTTGIVAGTTYYVVNAAAGTFQVAATVNGTAIDLVGNGTGVLADADWGAPKLGTVFKSLSTPLDLSFAGGMDDNDITYESAVIEGWSLFRDPETVDVNLLIVGEAEAVVSKYVIENVAEIRKDCVAFVSPPASVCVGNINVLDDVIAWREDPAFNVNSSYGTLDSGWKYQYDQYNDVYRWVPLNADIAGLHARTDSTNDAWWAAAGLNRGQIKNIVKLSWYPNQMARDRLYPAGVNPVTSFPGQGTVLFGQKTLLSKPSAFDRVNVRRLFIVLEKAISRAARYMLFEFNDPFTRAAFKSMVEPYLRMIQGRRGITAFKVVCDETNNTDYIVSTNQFIADIYIKPNYAAEFISLNFIATNNSALFTEQG